MKVPDIWESPDCSLISRLFRKMIFNVQMIVYIKDKCTTDTTQVQLCFFISEEDNSVANQQKFTVHKENGFVLHDLHHTVHFAVSAEVK